MKDNLKWMQNENAGLWMILGPYITTSKGEKKYLCRCECGTERYVLERSLRYGGSKSCGCLARRNATEKIEHKLKGRVFDDLEVIDKAEKKERNGGTWWVCRCSCGNIIEVPGTLLVTGRKTHCGCKSEPEYYTVDISERKFDRLTAKYPLLERDDKGSVIWHCVCECGNEVDLSYNVLMYSEIRSCGCWKKERESHLSDFLTHVDGTSLDMIKSKKLPSDNTSGFKGVYFQKGKWLAKIVFQKKQYHLGQYDRIEDAVKARKDAESLLFDGAAAHFERWNVKAKEDPEWATDNPVQIFVEKKGVSELRVTYLPIMDSSIK